jgi:multiple sugar transport system substrate-binding protein
MRRLFLIAATALVLVASAGCGGSSSSSNGVVNVTVWHGYEDIEGKAMTSAAARFNATHPKIHVTVQNYGNADYALQKVLTAIRGGSTRTSPTCTGRGRPTSRAARPRSTSPRGSRNRA